MKIFIVIFAGAIGLGGCASTNSYDGREFGFPKIYSGKPESRSTLDKETSNTCCTCCKENNSYVSDISQEAENALAKAGLKDIAFIAAIDIKGDIRLLKPAQVHPDKRSYNVEYDRRNYDVVYKRIYFSQEKPLGDGLTRLTPISMASYKGSHCFIWLNGRVDDISGREIIGGSGAPPTNGGSIGDQFCMVWYGPHP